MATKSNPGKFDCYKTALPDEPMFVLLARDPDFSRLVREWMHRRHRDILCGDRPDTDIELVQQAGQCAMDGENWRRRNLGKWRK
jgi:hypothetical protein